MSSEPWSQGGGINAGLMLLRPCARIYLRALREISQDLHPAHIPGAGPEQGYFRRLYAPSWHHISLKYNFQLHHILLALKSSLSYWNGPCDDANFPDRVSPSSDDVSVIHSGGALKLGYRGAKGIETDGEFFRATLTTVCIFDG